MEAIQRNRHTAGVANRPTVLVPSPEWRDGGAAILTSNDNRGDLALQAGHIDRCCRVVGRRSGSPRALASCPLRPDFHRMVAFDDTDIRRLGYPVVESRTAAASFGAAGAVAMSAAGACPGRRLICGDVGGTGRGGQQLQASPRRSRSSIGRSARPCAATRNGVCRPLQVAWASGIPSLLIQATSVAYYGTLRRPPPQGCPGDTTVAKEGQCQRIHGRDREGVDRLAYLQTCPLRPCTTLEPASDCASASW